MEPKTLNELLYRLDERVKHLDDKLGELDDHLNKVDGLIIRVAALEFKAAKTEATWLRLIDGLWKLALTVMGGYILFKLGLPV